VVAQDALECGPDAEQRGPGRDVASVGLELDALRPERVERVGQLEELRLTIRAARWNATPSHVHPISRRRCSGAIVMKRVLPTARSEARSIVANGTSDPSSAVARVVSNQARSAASSIGLLVIQRKTSIVRRDAAEVVEMPLVERLETDAPTGQRDRPHPGLAHPRMVAGGGSDAGQSAPTLPGMSAFSDTFTAFLDAFFELEPVQATAIGDHRRDGRWPDRSPGGS
jgi:hypothetical protein